jgi:hypothetical protein
VEPITAAVLATAVVPLVTGVAGEAGKQAWTSLANLVRRTFKGDSAPVRAIAELEAAPTDQARIDAAAAALAQEAGHDAGFAVQLASWLDTAREVSFADHRVTNIVAGEAHVQGPVVQARDISGPITFGDSGSQR